MDICCQLNCCISIPLFSQISIFRSAGNIINNDKKINNKFSLNFTIQTKGLLPVGGVAWPGDVLSVDVTLAGISLLLGVSAILSSPLADDCSTDIKNMCNCDFLYDQ